MASQKAFRLGRVKNINYYNAHIFYHSNNLLINLLPPKSVKAQANLIRLSLKCIFSSRKFEAIHCLPAAIRAPIFLGRNHLLVQMSLYLTAVEVGKISSSPAANHNACVSFPQHSYSCLYTPLLGIWSANFRSPV